MTKRYVILIDTVLCCGCNSCVVACKMENNLPDGNWWNRVLTEGGDSVDTFGGSYGAGSKCYLTISCQHCDNPACTRVCPVGATYKDVETGIVHQDYDKCIGCRMCMAACPYTGVRQFNWEEPKYPLGVSTGAAQVAAHQKHVVEKCTMCDHRLAANEEPMCVATCPAYARYFGDINDPTSQVSKLIVDREYRQLLPERGTEPSAYYLV